MKMKKISVGKIKSIPGEIVYGFLDVFEHPTGTVEKLPIIIAQGIFEGPTLWLTANVHGNEYTGIPVIHKVINNLNLKKLKGTIVAIPSMNPAGSRTKARSPYYDNKDPNRLFPDGNPYRDFKELEEITKMTVADLKKDDIDQVEIKSATEVVISVNKEVDKIDDPLSEFEKDNLYPSIQELIWKKLFEEMKISADYLIDLHNAYIKSIPFVFLDRVLYNDEEDDARRKAEILYKQNEEMVRSFGFTIIRELTPKKYVQKKLHRSTSGAALNYLRIPSFTVELGMYLETIPEVVDAAVIGVRNVMKWAKMLDGELEKIENIPIISEENIRYIGHPRVKHPCIIDLLVKEGDFVKKGDVIAKISDIFGRPLPEGGEIKTEIDGYIFMINEGILRYSNEEICWIAAKDVNPMIDKWPK